MDRAKFAQDFKAAIMDAIRTADDKTRDSAVNGYVIDDQASKKKVEDGPLTINGYLTSVLHIETERHKILMDACDLVQKLAFTQPCETSVKIWQQYQGLTLEQTMTIRTAHLCLKFAAIKLTAEQLNDRFEKNRDDDLYGLLPFISLALIHRNDALDHQRRFVKELRDDRTSLIHLLCDDAVSLKIIEPLLDAIESTIDESLHFGMQPEPDQTLHVSSAPSHTSTRN